MKILKQQGSIVNITYKDYTNTANLTGIPDSSNESDNLITFIKNNTFTYEVSTMPKDENLGQKEL